MICMYANKHLALCYPYSLRWRHNGHDDVSNHQPHHGLRNRLFGCRSKKTSKLRVSGLCMGNSPLTGEFPAQRASNAENVSIWWRHHVYNQRSIWTFFLTITVKWLSISLEKNSNLWWGYILFSCGLISQRLSTTGSTVRNSVWDVYDNTLGICNGTVSNAK